MNGSAGRGRLDGNARERGPLQSGLEDRDGLQSGVDDSNFQPMNAGIGQMRFTPNVTTTRLRGDLSDQELKQLSTHDIVIMQDRSSSMGEKDYFPMAQENLKVEMVHVAKYGSDETNHAPAKIWIHARCFLESV
jgi:hypothetical protein